MRVQNMFKFILFWFLYFRRIKYFHTLWNMIYDEYDGDVHA